MKIIEKKANLFTYECSLGHCVSEDLAMSKGIAVIFAKHFKRIDELRNQNPKVGSMVVLDEPDNRKIYYLVTKKRYYDIPTYDNLKSSLICMRDHIIQNNVKELALPRIASGLDRLKWDLVKKIIIDVFDSVDVHIIICYL